MARPTKTLQEHLRDGSFRADRHASALAHEGDGILTAHVLNAAAHVDPSGHWKVRKIKQSHKIDGLVASVIAYSRAARAPAKRTVAFAWA